MSQNKHAKLFSKYNYNYKLYTFTKNKNKNENYQNLYKKKKIITGKYTEKILKDLSDLDIRSNSE